jgi:fructose-specific phosphotransferase system IIC component
MSGLSKAGRLTTRIGFAAGAAASVVAASGLVGAATSGAVVAGAGACGVVEQADVNTINPISKKMESLFMRFLLFLSTLICSVIFRPDYYIKNTHKFMKQQFIV